SISWKNVLRPARQGCHSSRFDAAQLNMVRRPSASSGGTSERRVQGPSENSYQMVNVSYDSTRELYEAIKPQFIATHKTQSGRHLVVVQPNGGSSRQAQKVVSGEQAADVVTLGLAPDIDILRKRGLVAQDWAERLPNRTLQ